MTLYIWRRRYDYNVHFFISLSRLHGWLENSSTMELQELTQSAITWWDRLQVGYYINNLNMDSNCIMYRFVIVLICNCANISWFNAIILCCRTAFIVCILLHLLNAHSLFIKSTMLSWIYCLLFVKYIRLNYIYCYQKQNRAVAIISMTFFVFVSVY